MTRKARKWPKIPQRVRAPGGTIPVYHTEGLKNADNAESLGLWHENERIIELDAHMTPENAWRVFYHELTHVALTESGLANVLLPVIHDEGIDAICDAIATARMRERFG